MQSLLTNKQDNYPCESPTETDQAENRKSI